MTGGGRWPWTLWVFVLLLLASGANALGWWNVDWRGATESMYALPGVDHWLGTNRLGQDTLARLTQSLMNALRLGLAVGVCACFLGVVLGVIGGFWHGRLVDAIVEALIGAGEALPVYFLAAVFSAGFGGSLFWIGVALTISFSTGTARVVRARVLELSDTEFIVTAGALGIPDWRIACAHLPGTLLPMILIQGFFSIVGAIKAEAVLGFLSLTHGDHMGFGVLLAESAQDLIGGRLLAPVAVCSSFFLLVLLIHSLAEDMADRISDVWRFHGA